MKIDRVSASGGLLPAGIVTLGDAVFTVITAKVAIGIVNAISQLGLFADVLVVLLDHLIKATASCSRPLPTSCRQSFFAR